MKKMIIEPQDLRSFFSNASDQLLTEFLEEGLNDLILLLEEDDFFGTEGFEKRYG